MKLKFIVITLLGASIAFADNYQVCFTPGENCTQDAVNAINSAKSTINVQAYDFTSLPIIEALMNAEARGVKVQAILDKDDFKYTVIPMLQSAGIPIWIDYKVAIAHNKVMIIDQSTVITGSFNFTTAAQKRIF